MSALRTSIRTQTWCFAAADGVFFIIAVRYVYITWKVQRSIRQELLQSSETLRRAVKGFVCT